MAEDNASDGELSGIERYLNREVVIDTKSSYVYLGMLSAVEGEFIVLENADVHDCSQGRANKDLYVLDARRLGVQPNRLRVIVRRSQIISLSALDEVAG